LLFKHPSLGLYFPGTRFFFFLRLHHVEPRALSHSYNHKHMHFEASSSTCLFIGRRICYIQCCFLGVHINGFSYVGSESVFASDGIGFFTRIGLDGRTDGIPSLVTILTTLSYFFSISLYLHRFLFFLFSFYSFFENRGASILLSYLSYGTTL
jgi:hypothetical protein